MDKETDIVKLEVGRTYQQVVRTIEQSILSGQVAAGQALPSEEKLAHELRVNRSTIREALRVLEQHGLVRREPGRKKLIASIPDKGVVTKPLAAALVLHKVTFEELWHAMQALEPAIAGLAAVNSTSKIISSMEANLKATRHAIECDNRQALVDLDIEFHSLVADASKNRAMQMARQPLGGFFYPAFEVVMTKLNAGHRLLAAHEEILNSIKEKNSQRASQWMKKHIDDFQRGFELADLDINQTIESPSNSAVEQGGANPHHLEI